MADRVLFIGWGKVPAGREERALESFNDAVGLYGRFQEERRIERFDVTLLDPHAGLAGFIQIHGTSQQLAAIRDDADFRRAMTVASLVVDDLLVIDGFTGEGVAREMALYQDVAAEMPQLA